MLCGELSFAQQPDPAAPPVRPAPAVGPVAPAVPPVPGDNNANVLPAPAPPRPSRLLLASRTPRRRRLASTPAVFGDTWLPPVVGVATGVDFVTANLLLAGGSGRLKVADQNKAIPVDRAFLHYNHFHGGADVRRSQGVGLPPTLVETIHVDRFIVGFERTFMCGDASIELRMPFTTNADYTSADFSLDSGDIGNLSIILKKIWFERETSIVSYGMGIVTPTGSDVRGTLPMVAPMALDFTIDNRAVDLVPYVGIVGAPTDRFFYHGFMQLDIPLGGNRITVTDGVDTATDDMTEQVVFSFDVAAGYWFYRDSPCRIFPSLAGMIELHVNSSLNDADIKLVALPVFGMRATTIENANMTLGLHAELPNELILRFGAAFPLTELDQRFFHSELIMSLQRQF